MSVLGLFLKVIYESKAFTAVDVFNYGNYKITGLRHSKEGFLMGPI